MFIALSFSGSLATKCVSLNNDSCMARPALIDLNPVEPSYYLFMVSLDECNGIGNVADVYLQICVSNAAKDVNVKVFNMIRINQAKTLGKRISCDCKCKLNSTTCNSNQKWNND